MNVCSMMARMLNPDQQVYERLKAACEADPVMQALAMAERLLTPKDDAPSIPSRLPLLAQRKLQCGEIEPVTVLDPCCGSGRMFLGVMQCVPGWMYRQGFIEFYGMDIDEGCVLMAHINMMLHGVGWERGAAASEILDASDLHSQAVERRVNSLPEPFQSAYVEARTELAIIEQQPALPPATKEQAKEQAMAVAVSKMRKRSRPANPDQGSLF